MPITRVVPAFNPRGLVLAAITLGLPAGLLVAPVVRAVVNSWFWSIWHIALTLVLSLTIPAFLLGVVLARATGRIGPVFLAGVMFGVAQFVGLVVGAYFTSDNGWMEVALDEDFGWLVIGNLFGLMTLAGATGAALAGRLAVTPLVLRLVEQSGSLCWRCNYNLGAAAITTCPECGVPWTTGGFRARRLLASVSWLQRRAAPALATVATIVLGLVLWTLAAKTLPARQFISTFAHPDRPVTTYFRWTNDADRAPAQVLTLVGWVPFSDGSDRYLAVSYAAADRPGLPAAEIAVVAPPSSGLAYTITPKLGTAHIRAKLQRPLADHIARHGVPPALMQEFIARANAANWSPADHDFLKGPIPTMDLDPSPFNP